MVFWYYKRYSIVANLVVTSNQKRRYKTRDVETYVRAAFIIEYNRLVLILLTLFWRNSNLILDCYRLVLNILTLFWRNSYVILDCNRLVLNLLTLFWRNSNVILDCYRLLLNLLTLCWWNSNVILDCRYTVKEYILKSLQRIIYKVHCDNLLFLEMLRSFLLFLCYLFYVCNFCTVVFVTVLKCSQLVTRLTRSNITLFKVLHLILVVMEHMFPEFLIQYVYT